MNDTAAAKPPPVRHGALELLRAVPTGVSQVYLQESVPAGIVFLVALALAGPEFALAGLAGSAVGVLTALALRVPRERISQGLFGFNATLVVLGTVASFQPLGTALLVGIAGAVVATALARVADFLLAVPARTAPFVLTYWLIVYIGHHFDWIRASPSPVSPVLGLDGDPLALFSAEAEVFLMSGWLPGLVMLIGLALVRFRLAVGAFCGAAVALVAVELLPETPPDVSSGVYGFNAALVVVGLLATGRTWRSCLLAVPAVLLIQGGIEALGLLPTTFPFVLAMWTADLRRLRRTGSAQP
ncbi:urea transporter [Saccharopolyspora indica]|uniref:urea transporter n=1 Tax=Saccharopolyspora indica TaxID=1229659 RepID=UPI0022EA1A75|nr:urea transporter [Saccharopolyspora indica]MDA3648215.1 urea transporter [Saccharopolyspora indica]